MRMQSSRSTFRKCVVSRRSLQGSGKSTGNMTSARRWSSSSVWCFEHRHRMEGLWTFLAATFHPWSIMFYYAFLFFILLFFLLRPRVHFNSYWLNKFDFDFNYFILIYSIYKLFCLLFIKLLSFYFILFYLVLKKNGHIFY